MMPHVLNLFSLFLVVAPSISRRFERINPCIYNREDILPCRDHNNAGVVSPGANQYTIHATRFQRNPRNGMPICVKRKEGELLRDVEDLGTPQVKFIFSPGAEQSQPVGYVNQMLVEYNIVCETGQQAFIQFEELYLEPKNCERMCRDYIEINTGSGGRREYCGSTKPSDPILVETGHFTLKLRTSFYSSYPGFRVFVTCFRDADPCREKRRAPAAYTPYMLDDDDQPEEYFREPLDITTPPPVRTPWTQMTSTQKVALNTMVGSLYKVALSEARRNINSWPPSSYSRNELNDIRRLSELNPPMPAPIWHPGPVDTDGPDPHDSELPQRERKFVSVGAEHLSSIATEKALENENCCNPILRAVSSSYTTIAKRLIPRQLKSARIRFQAQLQPTTSP